MSHGLRVVLRECTTSTNDAVLHEARAALQAEGAGALSDVFAVVSRKQSAGRGRLGRTWASPEGGLYLSLLTATSLATEQLASLSPLTALAVLETLDKFADQDIKIKWPNDIVCDSGKLVGILVEQKSLAVVSSGMETLGTGAWGSGHRSVVVIGIGVNINRPLAGAPTAAAYLAERAAAFDADELAMAIISHLVALIESWQSRGASFAAFAQAYRARLSQLGEDICIRDAEGNCLAEGKVIGVDEQARLLISDGHETKAIAAGEVTTRAPG